MEVIIVWLKILGIVIACISAGFSLYHDNAKKRVLKIVQKSDIDETTRWFIEHYMEQEGKKSVLELLSESKTFNNSNNFLLFEKYLDKKISIISKNIKSSVDKSYFWGNFKRDFTMLCNVKFVEYINEDTFYNYKKMTDEIIEKIKKEDLYEFCEWIIEKYPEINNKNIYKECNDSITTDIVEKLNKIAENISINLDLMTDEDKKLLIKKILNMITTPNNNSLNNENKNNNQFNTTNIQELFNNLFVNTNNNFWSLHMQVINLFNNKNYISAIELCTKILNEHPNEPLIDDIYTYRGLSYVQLNQFDEAFNDFTTAIEKYSFDNSTAYLERGKIYFQRKEYQNALSDFNKAIKCNSNKNGDDFYNRALLYIELGQTEDAISDLKQAMKLAKGKTKEDKEKLKQLLEQLEPKQTKQTTPKANTVKKEVKQEIKEIKIQNCTKKDILSLECFDKEKAEKFIQERKNGKMWYDIDSFVQDFELQPHEMVMIQDRIKFPEKPKNKYGRKIDI